MSDNRSDGFFDNPKHTRNLALGLGALGGALVAIGISLEWVPMLVLGAITLAASGATWAVRGIKEDQAAEK